MIVACPSCKAKFKIDEARIKPPGVRLRCARCQTLFAVRKRVVEQPPRPEGAAAPAAAPAARGGAAAKILVAHGEQAVASEIQAILQKENYPHLTASDGVEALMNIQRERPEVVVVDVALPKMYGFEICEFLKRNESLSGIKVILVATEHNQRRYKRTADNFYGADDVIAEGEIGTALVEKIRRLLQGAPEGGETAPAGPATPTVAPAAQDVAEATAVESARPAEPPVESPAVEPAEPPAEPAAVAPDGDDPTERAREKARRLARIIVSDIALYNPDAIEKGIRTGGLASLVRDDLEEGYKLFRSRIDEAVAAERDFIREAMDAFVGRKRQEFGLPDEAGESPDRPEEEAVADDPPPADLGTVHDDF